MNLHIGLKKDVPKLILYPNKASEISFFVFIKVRFQSSTLLSGFCTHDAKTLNMQNKYKKLFNLINFMFP